MCLVDRAEEEENRRVGLERQREQLHEAVKFREEQRQTQRQKETKEREKEQGRSRPEDGRAKSAVPMKTPRRTVGGGVGGGNATSATSGAGSQTGALPRLSSNMSTAKPKKLGARRGTMQASNLPPLDEDKAAVEMPKIDVRYLPTEHARPLVPDADALPPHDVGHSSLRISWERHLSVQTRGYACAILYNLSLEVRGPSHSPFSVTDPGVLFALTADDMLPATNSPAKFSRPVLGPLLCGYRFVRSHVSAMSVFEQHPHTAAATNGKNRASPRGLASWSDWSGCLFNLAAMVSGG
jgi:hypothetical protein